MWEQQQAQVNTSWMELNGRSRVFSLVLLYFRFFALVQYLILLLHSLWMDQIGRNGEHKHAYSKYSQ